MSEPNQHITPEVRETFALAIGKYHQIKELFNEMRELPNKVPDNGCACKACSLRLKLLIAALARRIYDDGHDEYELATMQFVERAIDVDTKC